MNISIPFSSAMYTVLSDVCMNFISILLDVVFHIFYADIIFYSYSNNLTCYDNSKALQGARPSGDH
jgi:hypothetical protein